MNLSKTLFGVLAFLLLLGVGISGCKRPAAPAPYVLEEISNAQRELLGKRISLAILTQPDLYPLRSSAGSNNEVIYNYLQAYYDQANYFYRLAEENEITGKWNPNRQWRVYILETEVADAFTIPGGDFFITEGLLAQLNNESELFALMSFEASLIQSGVILSELAGQYVAEDFIDLLELGTSEGGLNRQDLLIGFQEINYEVDQIINIDEMAAMHICDASAFRKQSLSQLIKSFPINADSPWLNQKSFGGRIEKIESFSSAPNCGNRITDGSYQTNVLDLL